MLNKFQHNHKHFNGFQCSRIIFIHFFIFGVQNVKISVFGKTIFRGAFLSCLYVSVNSYTQLMLIC